MRNHFGRQLAVLATAFLAAGGNSKAATQVEDRVCALSVGGWQLCEKDGSAYLVEPGPGRAGRVKVSSWYVGAPTVKDESGRSLSVDPKGRSIFVRLARAAGGHARWTFEVTGHLIPSKVPGKGLHMMKEGPEGFQFKLRMAGGPFRGWYLGACDVPEAKKGKGGEPALRALKLVKDPRQAVIFTYVEVRYRVRNA